MRSEIAMKILSKRWELLDSNKKKLKPGQVIKCEMYELFKGASDAQQSFTAKIISIDNDNGELTVKFPDGTQKVINWIEFIIYILPLLEKIFFIVRGWFTKKTK
jgi:hypothetical protein